jgi:DNA-directed RNA polymerase subunit H
MSNGYDLYLNNLIYKSRKHLLEMLEDRGCNINKYKVYDEKLLINLHEAQIRGKFIISPELGGLDMDVKNPLTGERTIVKYHLNKKINIKQVDSLVNGIYEKYKLNGTKDCLIIMNINEILIKPEKLHDDKVTQIVNNYLLDNKFVQIYGLKNFMFNISKHILQPKHTILTNEQVKEVLTRFNLKLVNMPKITRENPMAKYIGARPNQVIQIERFNQTTGINMYYRLVIRE